jgi:hypothetical protein
MEIRISPLWATLAVLCAAAATFAGGYWAGMATAAAPADAAPVYGTFPDWFLPIWDAYDRNPAITPEFDFAQLYSGELDAAPRAFR